MPDMRRTRDDLGEVGDGYGEGGAPFIPDDLPTTETPNASEPDLYSKIDPMVLRRVAQQLKDALAKQNLAVARLTDALAASQADNAATLARVEYWRKAFHQMRRHCELSSKCNNDTWNRLRAATIDTKLRAAGEGQSKKNRLTRRLRQELAASQAEVASAGRVLDELLAANERLTKEREADKQDAVRYRRLRDRTDMSLHVAALVASGMGICPRGAELDAIIDKDMVARAAQGEEAKTDA